MPNITLAEAEKLLGIPFNALLLSNCGKTEEQQIEEFGNICRDLKNCVTQRKYAAWAKELYEDDKEEIYGKDSETFLMELPKGQVLDLLSVSPKGETQEERQQWRNQIYDELYQLNEAKSPYFKKRLRQFREDGTVQCSKFYLALQLSSLRKRTLGKPPREESVKLQGRYGGKGAGTLTLDEQFKLVLNKLNSYPRAKGSAIDQFIHSAKVLFDPQTNKRCCQKARQHMEEAPELNFREVLQTEWNKKEEVMQYNEAAKTIIHALVDGFIPVAQENDNKALKEGIGVLSIDEESIEADSDQSISPDGSVGEGIKHTVHTIQTKADSPVTVTHYTPFHLGLIGQVISVEDLQSNEAKNNIGDFQNLTVSGEKPANKGVL